VELRVTNLAALAFYRTEGFAETVRVPGYYRGREAGVRMMRLLRNPRLPLPAWQPPTLDGPRSLTRYLGCAGGSRSASGSSVPDVRRGSCPLRSAPHEAFDHRSRPARLTRGAAGSMALGSAGSTGGVSISVPPSCWEAGATIAPTRWSRRTAPQ
jgi:hypothetical protein